MSQTQCSTLFDTDPHLDAFIAAGERARAAVERIEAENACARERAWALWGLTDIWGLPLR